MAKELYGAPKYDVPDAPRDNKAIIEDNEKYIQPEYSPYANSPKAEAAVENQAEYNLLLQKQAEELMEEQENPFEKWDETEKTPEYLQSCADYTQVAFDKYNELRDTPDSEKESYAMGYYVKECSNNINNYLDEKYPGLYKNKDDENQLEAYDTKDEYNDFVNDYRNQREENRDGMDNLNKQIDASKDFFLKDGGPENPEAYLNAVDNNMDLKALNVTGDEKVDDFLDKTEDSIHKEIKPAKTFLNEGGLEGNPEAIADTVKQADLKAYNPTNNKEIDEALEKGNDLIKQEADKAKSLDIYSSPDLNGYYDSFYKNQPDSYANDLASEMAGASFGDAGNMLPNGVVAEAGAPTAQKIGTVDLEPARNDEMQFENEKQNQSIAEMQGQQALEQSSNNASKYADMLMAKYEADNKQYEATQQAYKEAGLDGPKMPGSKYYS